MNLHQKISGATLIEVTVGLVLLTISFLAIWMIYGQVVASSSQRLTRTAEAEAEAWLSQTLLNEEYLDRDKAYDWGSLERNITDHPQYPNLIQVQVNAYRKDHELLASTNQWVYAYE